jgi:hypothetical protein
LLMVGALGVGTGACGSASGTHTASHGPSGKVAADRARSPYRADEDGEVEEGIKSVGFWDADDIRFTGYGHPASRAEVRAIREVVEGYYAATGARDGRKACSLMTGGLAHAIATLYPPPPEKVLVGPGAHASAHVPQPRHRSCPVGMAFLFTQNPVQLSAKVTVVDVRVAGRHAYALVGSRTIRASFVTLYREPDGAWRVHVPFALSFS